MGESIPHKKNVSGELTLLFINLIYLNLIAFLKHKQGICFYVIGISILLI